MPSLTASTAQILRNAARDVVDGRPSRLSPDEIRQCRLQAWAYLNSTSDSVYRRELAGDFARAWKSRQVCVAEISKLLVIWHRADIKCVVMKGLALATQAYGHVATRSFGDVDILFAPDDMERAMSMASEWRAVRLPPDIARHDPCQLVHPKLGLMIELHVSIVPSKLAGEVESRRLTARVFEDAVPIRVAGAPARMPSPVDLILFGLAVNRGWSGDRWRGRALDYLDMRAVSQRFGLTERMIADRAAELRLSRTWSAFRRHCDAFSGRFDLVANMQSSARRLLNDLSLIGERTPIIFKRTVLRASRIPAVLRDTMEALPHCWHVLRILRRPLPPALTFEGARLATVSSWSIQKSDAELRSTAGAIEIFAAIRGVRRAAFVVEILLGDSKAGPCVVRSLCVLRILQAKGYQLSWVTGFQRIGNSAVGHAWLESAGVPVPGLGDEHAQLQFQVAYRSPE